MLSYLAYPPDIIVTNNSKICKNTNFFFSLWGHLRADGNFEFGKGIDSQMKKESNNNYLKYKFDLFEKKYLFYLPFKIEILTVLFVIKLRSFELKHHRNNPNKYHSKNTFSILIEIL